MLSMLLVLVVLLPCAVALLVSLAGRRALRVTGAVATATAVAVCALTVALATAVIRQGPVQAVAGDAAGTVWLGLHADRLGVLLLMLVCGVSALAQGFAGRYLSGDARRGWFVAATGLLTSGSAALVTAATLLSAAVAWTAAGTGLWLLLRTYPHLPSARDGARRAGRAFAVGDAALWTAVVIATVRWGSVDLRRDVPAPAADHPVAAAAVTGLLVVAALTRSAQVPWHRWLPATLAAPTPVSALLHAGVVNAGGVLLVRLSPVTEAAPAVLLVAVVCGAASLVYGTTMMLVRPDVKGSLAYSTMGQMGFMIMTVGLGWYAVTVFHIVAHGLYKATLFLGSGSAVSRHARDGGTAPTPVATRRLVTLGGLAAVTTAVAVAVAETWRPYAGGHLLAVFVWASATAVCWGWLRRSATLTAAAGVVATVVAATVGYVAAVHAITGFLALPARVAPGSAVVVAAVVVASAAVAVLRRCATGPLGGWHKTLYVTLLAADRPGRRRHPPDRPGATAAEPAATVAPITVGAAS